MAYAAVISLTLTIERFANLINPQITKSVHEELMLIENILKRLDFNSNSNIKRSVINALDAQIREAASTLEDVLEFYVLRDKCCPQTDEEDGLKKEIALFFETVKKLEEEYMRELNNPFPAEEEEEEEEKDVLPITGFGGMRSQRVGLSGQLEKIRAELLGWVSELRTVSLFGMAGIGKSFLAEEMYQHSTIVHYFDLRAWVKIGPSYEIKNIVLDLLEQIDGNRIVDNIPPIEKLCTQLHRSLYGRRYFIVLDDIWSTQVWDGLKIYFPNHRDGSRLLLTTRQEEVAKYPAASSVHEIPFLNNEESWELFFKNVFGEESTSLSHELEKLGRKIAENCEGLPLLILVVAGILAGLEKTEEFWKKVANKETTTFTDAYEKISSVLFSSYEYLPQHLKACFLYMGVFPQSSEVLLPKLINLWTVEGFLKQIGSRNLEECLKKLVSSSLVIICKKIVMVSDYRIKSSRLHSTYWFLCVKEARKNKFMHVLIKYTDGSKDFVDNQRRLSVQNNILWGIKEVYSSMEACSTARSILCTGPDHQYPVPICFTLLLLKVLDALAIRFYGFPNEVLKLLQLRYLALTHNGKLPPLISSLMNLQSLIVRQHRIIKLLRHSTRLPKEISKMQELSNMVLLRDSNCLPLEIWDMEELRHLHIMGSNLPNPSKGTTLSNLITLYVNAPSCTKDVFASTPNLRKLAIKIELQPDVAETLNYLEHVSLLHTLESLKCVVVNPRMSSKIVAPPDHLSNLPRRLTKLSLNGLGYSWDYIHVVGSLPNLQVLKLRCSAFQGKVWETKAEDFPMLKYLLLEDMDLMQWTTDDDECFPLLHSLIIRHCYKLKEIPLQLGLVSTLKTIEVVDCSPSVVASAQKIQEGEWEFGNSYLEVLISSLWNI